MSKPPPRSVAITTPQTCSFKWLVEDVLERPMFKNSPIFEIPIGDAKEQIQLVLCNNFNLIQISIKPINRLDLFQLLTFVSNASLSFRYGDNRSKAKHFEQVKVRANNVAVIFKVSTIHFTEVTNNYQDPFEVEVHLKLEPISPLSRVSLLSLPTPSCSESANDLVQIHWDLTDVNRLPLVKKSPLFTFNVAGKRQQISLSMETNNDRLRLRIASSIMHVKSFALSIDHVSLVLQPSAKGRPPIESEKLKVEKVIKELIYLNQMKLSFAEITANHKCPLKLTMQFDFREVMSNIDFAIQQLLIGIHPEPTQFTWKLTDIQELPFMKTSPWFKVPLADKSWLSVQFWLKQRPSEPIQLGLRSNIRRKDLALSVDRVTILFTDAKGLKTKFKRVVPELMNDLVFFDLDENIISFSELTNDYKDSFRIRFKLHPSSLVDVTELPVQLIERPGAKEKASLPKKPSAKPPAKRPSIVRKNPPTIQNAILPVFKPTSTPSISTIPNSLFAANPQPTLLLQQLNTLLVDQIDCDVHLDCQGTRIGAHRAILQARSPFAKELFLKNHNQTLLDFSHADAQTMADTLQFIYTEAVPQIANTAERLLSLADMLKLPELHQLAEQHLAPSKEVVVVESNTSASAKLLDMFAVKHLQPQVSMFIRENMDEFLGNPQFEQELKRRPTVCYDLIAAIHRSSNTSQV